MSRLELSLLGAPQIELDGRPIETDRRKAVALLVYLAVTGDSHTRDQLAALLWPEYNHASAFAYLRRTLWELNNVLGGGWFEADRTMVRFRRDSDFQLDTDIFEKLLSEPQTDGTSALEEAASLYRGDFLSGFVVPDTAPFEAWQLQEAEYFQQKFAGALERLCDAQQRAGMFAEALPHARRWLGLDPLNEAAHRAIMRLLASLGERSAAIRQYQACAQILREELKTTPLPETTALYEEIVHGEISGSRPEQPQAPPRQPQYGSGLPILPTSFIGRRTEVEEIKALALSSDHRLLTLIGPGGTGKTRLSIQSASEIVDAFSDGVWFISLAPLQSAEMIVPAIARGIDFSFYREEERARQQLLDYLRAKQLLLVLDNFEHLVDEGAELVAEMLMTAKNLRVLATSRERLNLDGEQLYWVAGMRAPEVASVIGWENPDEQAKPFSAIQLFVERAQRVQPDFRLTQENLPAITEICTLVEGMPLGIELAAAWLEVLTPKEIAAEIIRSLDFLARDDEHVSDRQGSLRAVFESSWRLLTEGEQNVFRHLTVFQGSFSREAAERVSGTSLRTLLGLANKSWLQQVEEGRYQLHEVLRQYGYERLQANADEWQAAKDRHAGYYLDFVEIQELAMRGGGQIEAADTLNKEFGNNLQAAWKWLVEREHFQDLVQRMLPGLFHFGIIRGQGESLVALVKEARRALPDSRSRENLLQRAILETVESFFELTWMLMEDRPRKRLADLWARVERFGLADEMELWYFVLMLAYHEGVSFDKEFQGLRDSIERIRVKNDQWTTGSALLLAYNLAGARDHDGEKYLEEAQSIFQALGVVSEQGSTLQFLGDVAWLKGSLDEAERFKRAALESFEMAEDQLGTVGVWFELAALDLLRGNFDRAFHAYQEQRRIYERIGNRRFIGLTLSWESLAASRYGTLEYALDLRQRSLALAREVGNLNEIAWHTWELGEVSRLMGDLEQAKKWYQQSLPLFEELQDANGKGSYYRGLGEIALELRQWQEAQDQFQKSLGSLAQEHRSVRTWSLAYTQAGLGPALIEQGKFSEGKEMLQASLRSSEEFGHRDLTLVPLIGFASLLAAKGEPEKAIQLAAFVANHRLSWNETKAQARALLEAASRDLPEEDARAAQVRGQAMTLDEAITFASGEAGQI